MSTAFAAPRVGQMATVAETAADGSRGLLRAAKDYLRYRRTLAELRALSPRGLADLGVSRFALRQIAWNATYGGN
jgi:uncharacterized protein YjiS (DUF1127 family)